MNIDWCVGQVKSVAGTHYWEPQGGALLSACGHQVTVARPKAIIRGGSACEQCIDALNRGMHMSISAEEAK